MPADRALPDNGTVLGPPTSERVLAWIGLPLAGLVVGCLLPVLARWAAKWAWLPFHGPLDSLASLPPVAATIGGLVVGLLAGLFLALLSEAEYVVVTITDTEITLRKDKIEQAVERPSISAIFVERKQLVFLGQQYQELAVLKGDLPAAQRLAKALTAHGYPWSAVGDPHREEYRRWNDADPDLSRGVHALFAARERALSREDDEATRLRADLAELGIVVHDTNGDQHWRRVLARRPDSEVR